MSLLISVAGGTASGKTTVVREISRNFSKDDIAIIYMDNYYKRRDDLTLVERQNINYDHPDAIDMELLKHDLRELLAGNPIDMPVYDFKIHNRSDETIKVVPTKVIMLEGILALYDEEIRNLSNLLLFVESEADIRFIRRLKRDMEERGRTMDGVINQYLSTVKPMFDAYVLPTKRFADIIIPNNTKYKMAIDVISAKIKEEL
ncbi:MAG: uridine kinase [Acholeplasmatales bacterium]|nr:uridine kinase [Acholeplasmatales bacterium]